MFNFCFILTSNVASVNSTLKIVAYTFPQFPELYFCLYSNILTAFHPLTGLIFKSDDISILSLPDFFYAVCLYESVPNCILLLGMCREGL